MSKGRLCLDHYPYERRGWYLYLDTGNPSGYRFEKWYRTEAAARRAALKWLGRQAHLRAVTEHVIVTRWNLGEDTE